VSYGSTVAIIFFKKPKSSDSDSWTKVDTNFQPVACQFGCREQLPVNRHTQL